MLRPAPLVLAFLGLSALAGSALGPAGAEPAPPRTLDLPREGFSLIAPSAWSATQPADALLDLRLGGSASVWFRRDTGKGDDLAARLRDLAGRHAGTVEGAQAPEPEAWKVKSGGDSFRVAFREGAQQHGFALVSQPRGRRLEVEWVHKAADASLGSAVAELLATLDVTAYEHSNRYVDLAGSWSLDVPHGWKRSLSKAGHVLFASDEQPPTVIAVRPSEAAPEAFEGEGVAVWKAAIGLETASVQAVRQGLPEGATRWILQQITLAKQGANQAFVSTEERAGRWLSVACPDAQRESGQEALKVPATFRAPAEPGARAGAPAAPAAAEQAPAMVPGSLEHASAPRLTFQVPAAWTSGHPSSSMRIAQWALPPASAGGEGAECIVFFFGPGGGGSVEANFERWKKQFTLEGEPATKTEEVAPGITAAFLEFTGRYTAEVPPGSGVRVDKPGWGLMSAVVQVQGGPLFIKCVGPKEALAQQRAGFLAWIRSLRLKA